VRTVALPGEREKGVMTYDRGMLGIGCICFKHGKRPVVNASIACANSSFFSSGIKSPAPAEIFQLQQICENSKFNKNFIFQSGSTSYYVCSKSTHTLCTS
jgi:hypothetical protein